MAEAATNEAMKPPPNWVPHTRDRYGGRLDGEEEFGQLHYQ